MIHKGSYCRYRRNNKLHALRLLWSPASVTAAFSFTFESITYKFCWETALALSSHLTPLSAARTTRQMNHIYFMPLQCDWANAEGITTQSVSTLGCSSTVDSGTDPPPPRRASANTERHFCTNLMREGPKSWTIGTKHFKSDRTTCAQFPFMILFLFCSAVGLHFNSRSCVSLCVVGAFVQRQCLRPCGSCAKFNELQKLSGFSGH